MHKHSAGRGWIQAEDGMSYFAAAGAHQAGETENLSTAHREAHAAEFPRGRQLLDAQQLLPERPLEMLRRILFHFASHHLVNDAVGVGVRNRLGGDVPAIAQNGDGIA